jgi:hypothetical protein
VRRFRKEIELAREVSHPNVCRIFDYGEEGPIAYLSMEIIPGEELHRTLKGKPRGLPEAEALSAILQIASGLQAIHQAGILHGDLKTAHALRDESGFVRIVPFGMVKDPLSADESTGSLEYMSPEHCWGKALDFRSDIYALGIVAFEVFTGDVPFRGGTPSDTLLQQMREPPAFDQEPGSRVPPNFVPILTRALEKAAADRFTSVEEFARALRSVAPGAPAVALSAPPPPSVEVPPRPPPETSVGVSPAPPPTPVAETPAPAGPREDARKDERFEIPTDVVLCKIGPGGASEKEERTIAHDLSRTGMRILTSWSDLQAGDQVAIQELGGTFSTGAVVRHVKRGTDRITRVGVEFVGNRAPDRLVGTTTGVVRRAAASSSAPPVPEGAGSAPTTRPGSSRPISRPRNSGPIPRPRNSGPIPRPRNSGPIPRPRNSGPIPRPRDSGPIPRRRDSGPTPRPRTTTSIPRPGGPADPTSNFPRPSGDQPPGASGAAPRTLESVLDEIAALRTSARGLVAESKIWEALEALARAQVLAEGTPEARAIRILTWETQAKIPSLWRSAQQSLEDLARSDPEDVAVHSALGRVFRGAGLSARARVAFSRVLALDPSNREAAAALTALGGSAKHQ